MEIAQKRKILIRIRNLEAEIAELKEIRRKLASAEFQSATIASEGGSKSYTRMDIGKLTDAIAVLNAELKANRRLLKEESPAPKSIYQVYF